MLQSGSFLGILWFHLNTCFSYYSSGNVSSGFHIIWISEDGCTHVHHIWITWVRTWQDHCFVLPKESLWDPMVLTGLRSVDNFIGHMCEWMNERNTHRKDKFDSTHRYMMLLYILTLISQLYWNQIKGALLISTGLMFSVFYCNYTPVKCSFHKMCQTNACPHVCPISITTWHTVLW